MFWRTAVLANGVIQMCYCYRDATIALPPDQSPSPPPKYYYCAGVPHSFRHHAASIHHILSQPAYTENQRAKLTLAAAP